jgi:hypothetical protein
VPNNRDIVLGYNGGSGGFLSLHVILLSDEYHIKFDPDQSLDQVLAKQWQISDPDQWKSHEVWPSVHQTMLDTKATKPRASLLCNPTVDMFQQGNAQYLLSHLIASYNSVKDLSWPDIASIDDWCNLPDHIIDECEQIHDLRFAKAMSRLIAAKKVLLYTDAYSQNELAFYKKAFKYHGTPNVQKTPLEAVCLEDCLITPHTADLAAICDCRIRLQDLVNTPQILVDLGLISAVNQRQLDLIDHWKSLHPPKLLLDIGIDI